MVSEARKAEIDILAITDHQTFDAYDRIYAESKTEGRALTVLPGIEITTHEGVHIIAIFPQEYSAKQREHFIGWLEIPGTGDTKIGSKKTVDEVLQHIVDEGGIVVAPHPWTPNIGFLSCSPKIQTRVNWLETGHIKLIQVKQDAHANKVTYIGHDKDGTWVNRYVLSSASPKQIAESTYCLAPFNRSDAHKPSEIGDGCSWFRMEAPTINGLRQVACEPRTRISLDEPLAAFHDCILAVRVHGGYCKDQTFCFNESLNCIVGDNHAGKSAVLDFIRFVLGHTEDPTDSNSRLTLLRRLDSILQAESKVELFLRSNGEYYVVERTFRPTTNGRDVTGCCDLAIAYVYDEENENLEPADDFSFQIEVYEQGRIGLLRSDIDRQLEMLDEFAELNSTKAKRDELFGKLTTNATALNPLNAERETLKTEIAALKRLEEELEGFNEQLPDEATEGEWGNAVAVVDGITGAVETITLAAAHIPDPAVPNELADEDDVLVQLFSQSLPAVPAENVADREAIEAWREDAQKGLNEIEAARAQLVGAIKKLSATHQSHLKPWKAKHADHEKEIAEQLKKSGVESPTQLRQQITSHRAKIRKIKEKDQPRLGSVETEISRLENERDTLRTQLKAANTTISKTRSEKAEELNGAFDEKIIVNVEGGGDKREYLESLREICDEITNQYQRIQKREQHLQAIASNVTPLELAEAVCNDGKVISRSGSPSLTDLCEITKNTQEVLCTIGSDIELVNKIEIVDVPDVPRIKVKREGEETYADLAAGLSPGEQSAAILTLALQTRSRPLIVDQPEDELGYSYVVNLIVPKMLRAKFLRQLIVVTHVANIPVLGDADYVIKLENRPHADTGRQCVVVAEGCFERSEVTTAVVQLEGGEQAFRFRQHRYSLTRLSEVVPAKAVQEKAESAAAEPPVEAADVSG